MAERVFLREVRLERPNKTLLFYQSSVGNVSCVVWDAALVLTKYIEKRCLLEPTWLRGRRVLELGAGLGCVGITAACFGGEVTLTDLSEVVPQLERTAELNRTSWLSCGGSVTSTALPWTSTPSLDHIKSIDVLLLSDCVYYQDMVVPLIDTMLAVCSDTTEVLLCQEVRESDRQQEVWKEFSSKLHDTFTVTKVQPSEMDHLYSSPDILLFKAKKKLK